MATTSASNTLNPVAVAKDFTKPLHTKLFTGYMRPDGVANDPAGTVLRCVANDNIACNESEFLRLDKNKRISFTILSIPKLGWATAPYHKPGKKEKAVKDPKAKPLYEVHEPLPDDPTSIRSVKMYNFNKANSNFDKGDRDDGSVSIVQIGQTLTFYLNEFLYDADKDTFPKGQSIIPRNSIVDVIVAATHNASGGYGLKLAKVCTHPSTLYSYLSPHSLGLLPDSITSARELVAKYAEQCEPIAQCVERSKHAFFAKVAPGAFVSPFRTANDEEVYRLMREDGNFVLPGVANVDIPFPDVCKFTNCPDDAEAARTLLDAAIAAGALSIFVIHDEWRCKTDASLSPYRGVPLVDADALLKEVVIDPVASFNNTNNLAGAAKDSDDDGASSGPSELLLFPVPWRLGDTEALEFMVNAIPKSTDAQAGPSICCTDFPLVSEMCVPVSRGYTVHLMEANTSDAILTLVFNAAPAKPACLLLGGMLGESSMRVPYKRTRVDFESAGK